MPTNAPVTRSMTLLRLNSEPSPRPSLPTQGSRDGLEARRAYWRHLHGEVVSLDGRLVEFAALQLGQTHECLFRRAEPARRAHVSQQKQQLVEHAAQVVPPLSLRRGGCPSQPEVAEMLGKQLGRGLVGVRRSVSARKATDSSWHAP